MAMELIKVTTDERGEQLVSGRELHEFLEVGTQYSKWFDRMVGYGFEENVDFTSFSQKSLKPFGGRPEVDHVMKLDMAKEISMIQRTAKGKQARQYFIEVEKQFKQKATLGGPLETALKGIIDYIAEKVVAEVSHKLTEGIQDAPVEIEEYTPVPLPPVTSYQEVTSSALAELLGYSQTGRKGAAQLNSALAEIGVLEKSFDTYGNSCWQVSERWVDAGVAVVSYYKGKRPWLRWTATGVSRIMDLAEKGILKVC